MLTVILNSAKPFQPGQKGIVFFGFLITPAVVPKRHTLFEMMF